jgi:hypothetical protein
VAGAAAKITEEYLIPLLEKIIASALLNNICFLLQYFQ